MDIKNRFGAVLMTLDADTLYRADLAGANLAGANLADANLTDADLAGANLAGASLRRANLAGANLRRANLADANLAGANLRRANLAGANLADTDLADADLADADLAGANLRRANLADADLAGAKLPQAPTIPSIHTAVYQAASRPKALDMGSWHTCETAHCRAGWVTTLAGTAGKELEDRIGPNAAAALIYAASDPALEKVPDFYATNENALADMKRLADREGGETSGHEG